MPGKKQAHLEIGIVAVLLVVFSQPMTYAQTRNTDNLIIVTLDGFRWQELFNGADPALGTRDQVTGELSTIDSFYSGSPEARRSRLLPFIWNTIGTHGQLYGNRKYKNFVNCSNPHWFSYPGYSEMFTGHVDQKLRSNAKKVNRNANVLEFIHQQKDFHNKVAVFSTWDVMPFILRTEKTGIKSNHPMDVDCSNEYDDTKTLDAAFAYLKEQQPRVLYISLDETDAYAHRGDYRAYLQAAHNDDARLLELWDWIQTNPVYENRTTLVITTDHGRGANPFGSWKHHGRFSPGSGQIWFAVIGPDTLPVGEMQMPGEYFQKQLAKTLAGFLGLEYTTGVAIGDRIHPMMPGYFFSVR